MPGHAPGPDARNDVVVALRGRRTIPQPPAPAATVPLAGGNAARAVDPLADLAVTVEALFLAHDRTLTDEHTAQAFTITMEALLLMLDGALAQGRVAGEEHQMLRGMVEGMRNAPQLL